MSNDITAKASGGFSPLSSADQKLYYPVIGIVKNNIDPINSSRLQVFISAIGGDDPDDSESWITVRYVSPFYGITQDNTKNADNFGNYVDTTQSYGFWGAPVDIGTEVICVFLNGDITQGVYIGCVPRAATNNMIPAIGATANVVIGSQQEASSFGGATRLPTTEINLNNSQVAESNQVVNQARPVHSYITSTYHRQGLLRDIARGPISSSVARESPSRVFGISTPGRPIFEGGFTDEDIAAKTKDSNDEQLKIVGRRGGHTFVMDDGDKNGKDQLTRIRTAGGHMIMLNDSEENITIIHSSGKSFIELGASGTIDFFTEDSYSIRAKGDINLHADKKINLNAGEGVVMSSKTLQVQTSESISVRAEKDFSVNVLGKYSVKISGSMLMQSSGVASFSSNSTTYVNGKKIKLNSGKASSPVAVSKIEPFKHSDTEFNSEVGFVEVPAILDSVATRVPTHFPWTAAGFGVYSTPENKKQEPKALVGLNKGAS